MIKQRVIKIGSRCDCCNIKDDTIKYVYEIGYCKFFCLCDKCREMFRVMLNSKCESVYLDKINSLYRADGTGDLV